MLIQTYKFTNSESLLKYTVQAIIEEFNQFKQLCVINKIIAYLLLISIKNNFAIVLSSMKLVSIILGMHYYCYYEISTAVVVK